MPDFTSINDFIKSMEHEEPAKLRLKYAGNKADFDIAYAIDQIECRRKCRSKLPTILTNENFRFPSILSSEQASSEATARFHATFLSGNERVLDLTCGLGIDDFFLSQNAKEIVTCEMNAEYAETAGCNFRLLGRNNITVVCSECIKWLENNPDEMFDVIMADPARRDLRGKRIFSLSDSMPDVVSTLPLLRRHASRLLIKASPMMDITAMCSELACVKSLSVTAVNSECKEIFADCDLTLNDSSNPTVSTYNLTADNQAPYSPTLQFKLSDLTIPANICFVETDSEFSGKYLYEPDAAVMKSGGYDILAADLGLTKLHPNTQLYISEIQHDDYPGKLFFIKEKYTLRQAKAFTSGTRRNIICRNFPLKPDDVAKKIKIIQGSKDDYLICGRYGNEQNILLDCKLINR